MIIGKLVGAVSTVISIGTKVISVVKTIAVGAKALWGSSDGKSYWFSHRFTCCVGSRIRCPLE